MMLDDFILFTGDRADNDRIYAQVEQVRYLVGDGLAGRAPVHVEAVGKHQPDLFTAVVHVCTLLALGRYIAVCKSLVEIIKPKQKSVRLFYLSLIHISE